MLYRLFYWVRDKGRGYSDDDVASLNDKLSSHAGGPGSWIAVTEREMRAFVSVSNTDRIAASKQYSDVVGDYGIFCP